VARRVKEASTSFLKKRSKKFFIIGCAAETTSVQNIKKFFASFFQKRSAFF